MILDYDPEAVYQDADVLQAQYEEEGRQLAADRRRGICHHGWGLGNGHKFTAEQVEAERRKGDFPERPTQAVQPGEGMMLCLDCGEVVIDPCH